MLTFTPMTKVDQVVEAAMALSDDERRQVAVRILKAVPTYDPELEASLARGIAEMRAGLGTDAEDFLAELEAEDFLATPSKGGEKPHFAAQWTRLLGRG
jgi:hypothetical protein